MKRDYTSVSDNDLYLFLGNTVVLWAQLDDSGYTHSYIIKQNQSVGWFVLARDEKSPRPTAIDRFKLIGNATLQLALPGHATIHVRAMDDKALFAWERQSSCRWVRVQPTTR